MEKFEVFNTEINYIKNDNYRKSLVTLLKMLPEYFFEVPASSTGKYHPSFALGNGGLVRHTKVAVRMGYELLINDSIGNIFTTDEKDLILISLLLHDGLKSGNPKEKYTRFDHPLLVSKFIRDNQDKLSFSSDEINLICTNIESHMGQWNTDYNGNEVLPKPKNRYQKFVHMCDYLASRKFIDVKFNGDEIE